MAEFDYHLDSVNQRLELLLLVLQYDSQMEKKFTVGERILIHYERSAMKSFIYYLMRIIKHEKINWYRVPDSIEEKIQTIKTLIEQLDWKPKTLKDD